MTNVVAFARPSGSRPARGHEFDSAELARLCRWYSAMRLAFPDAEILMTSCADRRVSGIALFLPGRDAPQCLVSKHDLDGRVELMFCAAPDAPRRIASLDEVIEPQIRSAGLPEDEAEWLDPAAWAAFLVATRGVPAGGASPVPLRPLAG